jgi:hypothetical protein
MEYRQIGIAFKMGPTVYSYTIAVNSSRTGGYSRVAELQPSGEALRLDAEQASPKCVNGMDRADLCRLLTRASRTNVQQHFCYLEALFDKDDICTSPELARAHIALNWAAGIKTVELGCGYYLKFAT